MSINRKLIIEELRLASDILDSYDEIPTNINDFDEQDLCNSNHKQLEEVINKYGGMTFKELHNYVFESIIEYKTEFLNK